jgi:hypothetical protein
MNKNDIRDMKEYDAAMAQCSGKVAHPTRMAADSQLKKMNRPQQHQMNVYRCDNCDQWHVGHKPGQQKRKRVRIRRRNR